MTITLCAEKIKNGAQINFPNFWKNRPQIPFFAKTPDQDNANKKISQIGPAIPQEIGHRQTDSDILLLFSID